MKTKILTRYFFYLLVITALCGLVYIAVQQDLRMSANDPQIAIAEDAAHALSSGVPVSAIVGQGSLDMEKSLAPFTIILNSDGSVIASSAKLGSTTPIPPAGVFEYVASHGENRFTWQPAENVRIAAVVTAYSSAQGNGFVLSGRSLREVEVREQNLTLEVALVWIFIFLVLIIAASLEQKNRTQS